MTDLSRFDDASFDATVCYGGPVSYTMDRADDAVAELLRVTKPGGYLLLSVMSKVGATRIFLPGVLELYQQDPNFVENVMTNGVLPKNLNKGHAIKMYSWAELNTLLTHHLCEIVAASARCLRTRSCGKSCSSGNSNSAPNRAIWTGARTFWLWCAPRRALGQPEILFGMRFQPRGVP